MNTVNCGSCICADIAGFKNVAPCRDNSGKWNNADLVYDEGGAKREFLGSLKQCCYTTAADVANDPAAMVARVMWIVRMAQGSNKVWSAQNASQVHTMQTAKTARET